MLVLFRIKGMANMYLTCDLNLSGVGIRALCINFESDAILEQFERF